MSLLHFSPAVWGTEATGLRYVDSETLYLQLLHTASASIHAHQITLCGDRTCIQNNYETHPDALTDSLAFLQKQLKTFLFTGHHPNVY